MLRQSALHRLIWAPLLVCRGWKRACSISAKFALFQMRPSYKIGSVPFPLANLVRKSNPLRTCTTSAVQTKSNPTRYALSEEYRKVILERFSKQPSVDDFRVILENTDPKDVWVAWDFYTTFLKAGLVPNSSIIAELTRISVEAAKPQKAVPRLWRDVNKFSIPVNQYCFRWLAIACNKGSDFDTALQLLDYAKEYPYLMANEVVCTNLSMAFRSAKLLDRALELLQLAETVHPVPNSNLYHVLFSLCADLRNLEEGRRLHKRLAAQVSQFGVHTLTVLITMYARCGSLEDAVAIFQNHAHNTTEIAVWNAMATAFHDFRIYDKIIQLFDELLSKGIAFNAQSIALVLSAIKSLPSASVDQVKRIHALVSERHIELNKYVASALIACYARCGSLSDVQAVFDATPHTAREIPVWNAIIHSYMMHKQIDKAVALFHKLVREGKRPDPITLVSVLCGYAKVKRADEALELFHTMEAKYGVRPDSRHALYVVMALCDTGRFSEMMQFIEKLPAVDHRILSYPVEKGADSQMAEQLYLISVQHNIRFSFGATAKLISIFARIHKLNTAVEVFERFRAYQTDVIVWTSLINAYVLHARYSKALATFNDMLTAGVKPDADVFTAVLNGCAMGGLVDEAMSIFHSMENKYGIRPNEDHHRALKQALIQAGRIDEANRITMTESAASTAASPGTQTTATN